MMELTSEEIQALVEYHRAQQYETARVEDYASAEYYKRRAAEWASFKETIEGMDGTLRIGESK